MQSLLWQLKRSNFKTVRQDLVAGLTVAVILIPQGMAYAMLAGLPPIYGLYAGLVPLVVYPFFGTSRQLSVGPVALVSILILSGLSVHAAPGSPEFIEYAILTAMVAGVIQIVLGGLKMGFLVNFLSHPVIQGFTAAAAIIIGLSQLNNLLGIGVGRSASVISLIKGVLQDLHLTNFYALGLGGASVLIILLLKKIKKTFPAALLVVGLGTAIVYYFSWNEFGVEIVEGVPKGLPDFIFPDITLASIWKVLPTAFIICLISFIESLAIAKTIAARHDRYPIHPNSELFGLGLAKVVGSLFQAFPNTGSFTRSAINDDAGAKTGLSSIFTAIVISIVLLFFTGSLYYLPKTILSAIVIAAVIGLIHIRIPITLFRKHRSDFYAYISTFLGTILFGIQVGVLFGIGLSLLLIIYKVSKPHFAVLGKVEGTPSYRNIDRFEDLVTVDGILVLRYDADIFFGNSEHFYESVADAVAGREDINAVVLDAGTIIDIDYTGIEQLEILINYLHQLKIEFLISGMKGPLRDLFHKTELNEMIPFEHQFLKIQDAVDYFTETRTKREKDEETFIKQTNLEK